MMKQQRVTLVTGAARGIGLAITSKLLDAGHRVAMVDLDGEALTAAAAAFPAERVMTLAFDISQPEAPQQLDQAICSQWGPVSILINNAAVSPKHAGKAAGLAEITLDEWEFVMRVNVTAPMRLAQHFVPQMRSQGWGRVVNTSSRAGRSDPFQASPAYATSKAAILGLTRSIASEFAPYGVTANAVAPGMVETKLLLAVSPEVLAGIRSRTPVGRGGSPEEIAAVICFLASEEAAFVTGACFDVNGGAFMC
jgi:3-oxoacyl-[acyl-carrier protein] reductase